MKSTVVEEQEQKEESESGFVFDLDQDTLLNVLKRVDMVTLEQAECVNKLWCKVARDNRLWEPIAMRTCASSGWHAFITNVRNNFRRPDYRALMRIIKVSPYVKPPPLDFYSIDPQVFSRQRRPWVSKREDILFPVPCRVNDEYRGQ